MFLFSSYSPTKMPYYHLSEAEGLLPYSFYTPRIEVMKVMEEKKKCCMPYYHVSEAEGLLSHSFCTPRIEVMKVMEEKRKFCMPYYHLSKAEGLFSHSFYTHRIKVMNVMEEKKIPKPVVIRKIWANNVEFEFHLIGSLIRQGYSFIAMDTEFPGQIEVPRNHRDPHDNYRCLKINVDALNIIQVGFTLSDKDGNLPDLGTPYCFIWEFNFCDFNLARGDDHAPASIALLRKHGINFDHHAVFGIHSYHFALLMFFYKLARNDSVTWITFHGAYDFGYLIKILTRECLPSKLEDFLKKVKRYFGNQVYDVKHMIRYCNQLYGGLERVARSLNLDRSVGECHQAGSDSWLTSQVFHHIILA